MAPYDPSSDSQSQNEGRERCVRRRVFQEQIFGSPDVNDAKANSI